MGHKRGGHDWVTKQQPQLCYMHLAITCVPVHSLFNLVLNYQIRNSNLYCEIQIYICNINIYMYAHTHTHTHITQFSRSVVSNSLRPHGLQHTRPPCPSPSPGACSNSCPLSQWCHPTISSSIIPFSSCLQSFPASGSSPMSQFFTSGGQKTGASTSASVLPINIQDWFPLGLTDWIS